MIPFTQFQVIEESKQLANINRYRIFGLDENGIIWTTKIESYQMDSDANIPGLDSGYSGAMRWKKVPTP